MISLRYRLLVDVHDPSGDWELKAGSESYKMRSDAEGVWVHFAIPNDDDVEFFLNDMLALQGVFEEVRPADGDD